MATGKIPGFFFELAWNLKENFFSKWFFGMLAVIVTAVLSMSYLLSFALLKAEIITSGIGFAAYILILVGAVAIPVAAVVAISTLHAIQHRRKGDLTILGDFMSGLQQALVNFGSEYAIQQMKLVNANKQTTLSPKGEFIAVEITLVEIQSEIKGITTKLYQDLEKHFQHRDLELLTYQETIMELGYKVDPEIELERRLLRHEWEGLKVLANDPDPAKFFSAVEHYLNDVTHEISDMECLLDEKYDLDTDRNSLFFISSSDNDTDEVRADLEIIKNPERGIGLS